MTITVIDTVAPTLTDLPEDITISCEEWPSFETSPPSAQDICDPAPTGPTSGASDTTITPGDCSGNFTVLFTYTFSDLSGNTASHSQTVTVEDLAPPGVQLCSRGHGHRLLRRLAPTHGRPHAHGHG